jgi:hypothetical protein
VTRGGTRTLDKVEAVATGILSATYEKAATILNTDVSNLRVWRQEPKIRARVKLLRQQLLDERLARFRAKEQMVEEEHFKLIFSKGIPATQRLAAIDLYYKNLEALQGRAAQADNEADFDH